MQVPATHWRVGGHCQGQSLHQCRAAPAVQHAVAARSTANALGWSGERQGHLMSHRVTMMRPWSWPRQQTHIACTTSSSEGRTHEQDSASRRGLLLSAGALMLTMSAQGPAGAEEPAPQPAAPAGQADVASEASPVDATTVVEQPKPAAFDYPWESDVPHNLRVKEYWAILIKRRPIAWQRIAIQIQTSQYMQLSEDLNAQPFADLRSAALFIPWAMVQRDDIPTATEARKAYNDWESHVQDLQTAAVSAASGDSGPERVQACFNLMSASMDSFLATIPSSYLGKGPKA